MSIFITGDTHGYYNQFMERLDSLKLSSDDTIIVLGDFGFVWNNSTQAENFKLLTQKNCTFAFTDGNHEDFDLINTFPVCEWNGGKVHMIAPNIIHLMRGQIFTIDNKTFFTFGGGYSSDKARRVEHQSWWKEEMPDSEEYGTASENLEKYNYSIDYVLTHTGPLYLLRSLGCLPDIHERELNGYFDWLYDRLDFKQWFSGHFHINAQKDKFHILIDDVIKL